MKHRLCDCGSNNTKVDSELSAMFGYRIQPAWIVCCDCGAKGPEAKGFRTFNDAVCNAWKRWDEQHDE